MKIRVSDIEARAKLRPKGYIEDVLSKGIVKDGVLEIDRGPYIELLNKYAPTYGIVGEPACCGKKAKVKVAELPPTASVVPDPNRTAQKPSLPPITTQIKNATKAAVSVARDLIVGQALNAPPEEVAKRREICDSCEFFLKDRQRCAKCGCFTQPKTSLRSQSCPLKKW